MCVYMLSWKLGAGMLSWDVLIADFSSWPPATCQPASQATELPCLNSFTRQVMSDSTLPLLDTGRAPGSQDRLRDTSRQTGLNPSDFCFLAPKADSGTGRGRHVRLREAGVLYHPPHPGLHHFLFSTKAKGCQYPALLLLSPHPTPHPRSPTLQCGHLKAQS